MIDRELVTRKLVLISADLIDLEAMGRKPRAEYLASATDELVTERLLERIIDVNYHLLTESGAPPPSDYPEKVHGALETALRDVPKWLLAVRDYLDRKAP